MCIERGGGQRIRLHYHNVTAVCLCGAAHEACMLKGTGATHRLTPHLHMDVSYDRTVNSYCPLLTAIIDFNYLNRLRSGEVTQH